MQQVNPHDIIFIDIETVSAYAGFAEMPEAWQQNWEEKIKHLLTPEISAADFYEQRAGVMAEFSKIVCISMGYLMREEHLKIRVKSFYGHQESDILKSFLETMRKIEQNSRSWHFGGHNIKEFDIPFICRRLLANGFVIPDFLDFQNMKPWETNIVDSFQYWKFGDYKNFTSLKLLAAVLNIPSPKEDMDGSKVGGVYWKENDLERIASYCQKDVVTVANVFLRFNDLPLLHDDDVELVVEKGST